MELYDYFTETGRRRELRGIASWAISSRACSCAEMDDTKFYKWLTDKNMVLRAINTTANTDKGRRNLRMYKQYIHKGCEEPDVIKDYVDFGMRRLYGEFAPVYNIEYDKYYFTNYMLPGWELFYYEDHIDLVAIDDESCVWVRYYYYDDIPEDYLEVMNIYNHKDMNENIIEDIKENIK